MEATYYFKEWKNDDQLWQVRIGVFDGYFDYCYGADGAMLTGAGWNLSMEIGII